MKQDHTEGAIEHTDGQQNTGNHRRHDVPSQAGAVQDAPDSGVSDQSASGQAASDQGGADKVGGTRAGAANVDGKSKG